MLTWGTLAEYLEGTLLDAGDDLRAWAAEGVAVLERPYMRLVAKGRPDPWYNWVERVRLDPERVPGAIQEAREFFAGEGVPYSWWVGPSTRPADLGDRLAGGGLRAAGRDRRAGAAAARQSGCVAGEPARPYRAGNGPDHPADGAAPERHLRAA